MRPADLGVFLFLTASLAGCKGSAYWMDRLNANPLYQRANQVRRSAGCAGLIPMEFSRAFPVPVRGGGRNYFEVLFYPSTFSPSKFTVMTPTVQAGFSADSPDADRCTRIEAGPIQELGPAMPARLSMAKYYRAATRLFEALAPAAALYFKGAPLGALDKRALADYEDAFVALAEPGLLPYYYRLNPDFWEWLRKEAGRSIPKA